MRVSRLWLAFIFLGVLFVPRIVNNDAWFLLSDGRYLVQYGFPHTEPFSMHEGLSFVMQQWLFSLGLWKLYTFFGIAGLYAFSYVSCALLVAVFFLLARVVSGGRELVPAVLAGAAGILIAEVSCQRPQMVSTLLLLLEVLALEYFGRREKRLPVFFLLPVLSVLIVNLHAALWPMALVVLLPYLAAALVSRRLPSVSRRFAPELLFSLRELLGLFFLVLAAGLLNPYGTDAMLYSLRSYGDEDIQGIINEMAPLAIRGMHYSFLLPVYFALTALYARCRLRLSLVLLAAGTALMSLLSVRSVLLAVFFVLLPLAGLSGRIPGARLYERLRASTRRERRELFAIGILLLAFVFYSILPRLRTSYVISPYLAEAVDIMARQAPAGTPVYADFNDGPYVEFRGFRPYLDARAEVYTKRLNHRKNYFHEYRQVQSGLLSAQEFLARYDFPWLIVNEAEPLYHQLPYVRDYELVYDSKRDSILVSPLSGEEKDLGIRLYRRRAGS
jgi:hypothetical protein